MNILHKDIDPSKLSLLELVSMDYFSREAWIDLGATYAPAPRENQTKCVGCGHVGLTRTEFHDPVLHKDLLRCKSCRMKKEKNRQYKMSYNKKRKEERQKAREAAQ